MLVVFYDMNKHLELLTNTLAVLPAVTDWVVIRGIVYDVVNRSFDYTESPPVCRIDCEVRA